MAGIDRAACLNAFGSYVDAFGGNDSRIALKREHTMRVAELCDGIAASFGMLSGDVDLAWLCGLLHDIGRFEQPRVSGTFKDAVSCSHVLLGLAALNGEREFAGYAINPVDGWLNLFADSAEDAAIVRQAVGLHTDLRLPAVAVCADAMFLRDCVRCRQG